MIIVLSGSARKYGPSVTYTSPNLGSNLIISQIFCDWAANFYKINVECFIAHAFLLSCVRDFNELYFENMFVFFIRKVSAIIVHKM